MLGRRLLPSYCLRMTLHLATTNGRCWYYLKTGLLPDFETLQLTAMSSVMNWFDSAAFLWTAFEYPVLSNLNDRPSNISAVWRIAPYRPLPTPPDFASCCLSVCICFAVRSHGYHYMTPLSLFFVSPLLFRWDDTAEENWKTSVRYNNDFSLVHLQRYCFVFEWTMAEIPAKEFHPIVIASRNVNVTYGE